MPPSFVDDLRRRDDAQLAELLLLRPDLTHPLPVDISALAARAATATSVRRAIDDLDEGLLAVLQCLAFAERGREVGGSDESTSCWAAAVAGVSAPPGTRPALDRAPFGTACEQLWARALLTGHSVGRRVRPHVLDALGASIAGLTPGAVSEASVAAARDAVRHLNAADREVLAAMAWSCVGVFDEQGPLAARVTALAARGLLEQAGPGRAGEVRLPAALALALRGGRLHRTVPIEPPDLPVMAPGGSTGPDQTALDAAAGFAAADLLRNVVELARLWEADPPRVLRAGGLAVAGLRVLARALDVPPDHAAFVAEIAYAAGLVDDDRQLEPTWAPTPAYDEWRAVEPAQRWAVLAQAWLGTTRAAHLVGTRPPLVAGSRAAPPAINALTVEADSPVARPLRLDVLTVLASLPAGAGTDPGALVARLRWRRPLHPATALAAHVRGALDQATWLGLVASGGLSSPARLLLTGADLPEPPLGARLIDAAAAMLPRPVNHVLLQADLTAVAPGPLEDRLADFLRLVAQVESRGGATVYRFDPVSVRRALDAGWDRARILSTLEGASRTGVPQPLQYLVGDVARRHGGLRVGTASTYVRGEEPVALDDVMARPEMAPYRPRRLAPTVLACDAAPGVLLSVLREIGMAPVAEGRDGTVVIGEGARHRTPPRREHLAARWLAHAGPVPRPGGFRPAASTPRTLVHHNPGELVAKLRAGDAHRADETRRGDCGDRTPLRRLPPADLAAFLRDAAAERRTLWLGVLDGSGAPRRVRLEPVRVEAGRLHGLGDDGRPRSYALHRIDGVTPVVTERLRPEDHS
ncbi:MAG: helicase-associated domain-containing protein [Dermatophilaceae bacterium]